MDIEHIREFLVFAKAPSVSAAAKQMHLTQPTLSNHIAALESELGTELVHHGRNMRLTNAGRVFVDLGEDLVKRYDAFASTVKETGSGIGELNVLLNGTYTPTLYSQWVRFAHIYLSRHPHAALRHANCSDATVWEALRDGRFDCCIVPYVILPSDIERGVVFKKLPGIGGTQLGIWVKKDAALSKLSEVHWANLNDCNHPIYSGAAHLWNSCIRELFASHGIEANWRPMPGDIIGSGRKYKDDEIAITDSVSPEAAESIWPDWTVVPIAEPDAVSCAYLAYLPDNDSLALSDLLSYLHNEYEPELPNY